MSTKISGKQLASGVLCVRKGWKNWTKQGATKIWQDIAKSSLMSDDEEDEEGKKQCFQHCALR